MNIKVLNTFQGLHEQFPLFSNVHPICNQQRRQFKPLKSHTISINTNNQNNNDQNTIVHMSDLEFRQIQKFFRVTISSIKNATKQVQITIVIYTTTLLTKSHFL